jgi:hypothetical protein
MGTAIELWKQQKCQCENNSRANYGLQKLVYAVGFWPILRLSGSLNPLSTGDIRSHPYRQDSNLSAFFSSLTSKYRDNTQNPRDRGFERTRLDNNS